MPDLEPLDTDVRALLAEAEPKNPQIGDEVRTQMRARLQTALSVPPNVPGAAHAPAPTPVASPASLVPKLFGAGAVGVALGVAGTLGAVSLLTPPPQAREVPV